MKTSRNLLILLLLLALGGAYYWFHLLPQRPAARRLAPPGTVYLLQYVSVPRPGGVIGFAPGTALRLVGNRGAAVVVSDGTYEAEVPRSATTDDLDLAAAAGRADGDDQRRLAAERARVEREAAALRQRANLEQQRALAEIERRRLQPPPSAPAPTPSPRR